MAEYKLTGKKLPTDQLNDSFILFFARYLSEKLKITDPLLDEIIPVHGLIRFVRKDYVGYLSEVSYEEIIKYCHCQGLLKAMEYCNPHIRTGLDHLIINHCESEIDELADFLKARKTE